MANCWSTRTPLTSGAICWLLAICRPTVGQLLVNHATIGLLGHQGTLLGHDQLLVNQDTIGLLGHQGSLLAHGQPLANCWSTRTPLTSGAICWLLAICRPTVGQLLVNHGTVGLLGHLGTLLAHGQALANCWSTRTPLAFLATRAICWLLVNCWPTVGQPGHHWPSWPPDHTALSRLSVGQLLVNHGTIGRLGLQGTLLGHGQLLVNHWSTRTPLAFLASRAHYWLMVNSWSTTGQPGHHWPSWPPGNTPGSLLSVGQLLVSQDTIGLLCHQDTLLAHGQLLVSCWSTMAPLTF